MNHLSIEVYHDDRVKCEIVNYFRGYHDLVPLIVITIDVASSKVEGDGVGLHK